MAQATMFVAGGRPLLVRIGGSKAASLMSSIRLSAAACSSAVGRLEVARKASACEAVRCSGRRALLRGPESSASSAMGIESRWVDGYARAVSRPLSREGGGKHARNTLGIKKGLTKVLCPL